MNVAIMIDYSRGLNWTERKIIWRTETSPKIILKLKLQLKSHCFLKLN